MDVFYKHYIFTIKPLQNTRLFDDYVATTFEVVKLQRVYILTILSCVYDF